MPTAHVWDDEYTGPRYTYHSPLRPISPTLLPAGSTVVLTPGYHPREITVTAPLPDHFIQQWDLQLVPHT